jgi:hypothetical protein
MVYRNCFTICVLIAINKQTNKQLNNLLSITETGNMGKLKLKFHECFYITKKYYNLACMDGIKT